MKNRASKNIDNGMEKSEQASSTSIRAKITRKERVNRRDEEAYTGVIRKKWYELFFFTVVRC